MSATEVPDPSGSTSDNQDPKTDTQSSESMTADDPSKNYVLVNNVYYYTDATNGKSYKHDSEKNEWVEVTGEDIPKELSDSTVNVDEDGRKYYHSDGYYLCQDSSGQVFYMDGDGNWQLWESKKQDDDKWFFYKGKDRLYRDTKTRKVYKYNEEAQEWRELKRTKKKRERNEIEEYDTDEEEELSEYEEEIAPESHVPMGYGSDPSIQFDGKTYTRTDPSDNIHYEWDMNKRAWFPKVDEDFMATYQLSYGFKPDGTKDENPLKFDDDEEEEMEVEEPKVEEKKKEKKKPEWFEVEDQHNTKVYVSNLPTDITEKEFVDFMQKCGLVLKDSETNQFKVKLYKDADGNYKGDALCSYIRVESVDLALQILDGYMLRDKVISVQRAKFTLKGSYNPAMKPRKKRKRDLEKQQKIKEKLFDWRPEPMRGQRSKWENTVIVKNAFEPKEFDGQEDRLLELQESMRQQCTAFGTVKKVTVFDRHPEGVIQVAFNEVEAADMCILTLNNRLFNKRKISVATWDGKQKFNVEETEEEKAKRLQKWDEYLQSS